MKLKISLTFLVIILFGIFSSCSKSRTEKIKAAFAEKGYTSVTPPIKDNGDYYDPNGLVAPCAGQLDFCGVYAAKNKAGTNVYVLVRIKESAVELREIGAKEQADWFDALHKE